MKNIIIAQYDIGLINWKSKELTILTDTTYNYQQSPTFVEISK